MCDHEDVKDSPFFGFFMPLNKPTLMMQSPELLKRITVKDFSSFSDRHMESHKGDPLGFYNMVMVKGAMWRKIRSKMSPFFTSGKLKLMFYLVDKTWSWSKFVGKSAWRIWICKSRNWNEKIKFKTENCIGERFGLMVMKMGIVKILMNFKLEELPETPEKIIQLSNSVMIQSNYCKIHQRSNVLITMCVWVNKYVQFL